MPTGGLAPSFIPLGYEHFGSESAQCLGTLSRSQKTCMEAVLTHLNLTPTGRNVSVHATEILCCRYLKEVLPSGEF